LQFLDRGSDRQIETCTLPDSVELAGLLALQEGRIFVQERGGVSPPVEVPSDSVHKIYLGANAPGSPSKIRLPAEERSGVLRELIRYLQRLRTSLH
jgi:hypothetical protein